MGPEEEQLICHQENPPLSELYQANLASGLISKIAKVILYTLFKYSVMAMAHCKHIMINTNNIKLVLDISIKIRSNYFSLIDAFDCPAPATTTHHLCAAPALPTTTAITPPPPPSPITTFLPFPGAVRVSTHQITGIRAPVQFTKPVLEKQKKKKEKKKKKKKKKK
ncbi:uncharacterized protein CIMG_13331 [Coccidioides immitis RS]|uniref:Uncharacterized protein n=1 Tax=Coccidioides immitis (strain RS) TaxID=246410 RepID=J3K3H2_COCIM|nr:uncharacterized protein CIMG_13331 [Coccidioides immitis RS]EAS28735.3 hypothetical protein CIMG_13331 [Coccidioides immitis RS]